MWVWSILVASKTWSHRSSSSLPQQQLLNIQQQSTLDSGGEGGAMRGRSLSMNIPSPLDLTGSSLSESEFIPEIIMELPTPRRCGFSTVQHCSIRYYSIISTLSPLLSPLFVFPSLPTLSPFRNSDSAIARIAVKKSSFDNSLSECSQLSSSHPETGDSFR